jgi:hypothetical protein
MAALLTTTNIMFGLGIMGVIFTIFNYFRNPQITSDKNDAILAQQLEWSMQGTDRRFKDMQDSFKDLLLQSNNHIHTLDTKVEAMAGIIAAMGTEFAKLSTIIDERIPKKI